LTDKRVLAIKIGNLAMDGLVVETDERLKAIRQQ
jgi:hypothetical protein